MSVEALRDESGIRIRVGRDPQMVMEDVGGEAAPTGEAPTGEAPTGEAPAEVTAPTGEAEGQGEGENEDLSNWTVEDAVKKLKETRQEAAKYRTRAQKFEAAFEGLDDASTDGLIGLVAALKTGDPAVVPVLKDLLSELSPEDAEAVVEAIEQEAKSLTPEEVEKLIDEREAKKESERLAQENFSKMKTEITELGYTLDEATPDPSTSLLFFFAGQQPKDAPPDFKAAHEKVQEFRENVINDFKSSVNQSQSRFARVPSGGAVPTGGKTPKTRDQASAALKAMLEAQ